MTKASSSSVHSRFTACAGELYCKASDMMGRSRDRTQWMMKKGFIPEASEE